MKEVNPKQEMGEGKMFVVGYHLPVYGEYKFLATVTQWESGKWVKNMEILQMKKKIYLPSFFMLLKNYCAQLW